MSDMVCTISTAQAVGMACSMLPAARSERSATVVSLAASALTDMVLSTAVTLLAGDWLCWCR